MEKLRSRLITMLVPFAKMRLTRAQIVCFYAVVVCVGFIDCVFHLQCNQWQAEASGNAMIARRSEQVLRTKMSRSAEHSFGDLTACK
jgi:hypothetical protein